MTPAAPGDRALPAALPVLVLVAAGLAWGATQSLGKVAASTGHGPFGLIVWQQVVAVAALGPVVAWRRRPLRLDGPALRFAFVVALIGTVLPNATFYLAVARLPAGVMSVVIAAVPLLALPMAVALGRDRLDPPRVLGLLLGAAGVVLLAAPGAALPSAALAPWLLVALCGPVLYAAEANYVAAKGHGLDPVQAILLASLMALGLALPLAALTGALYAPWAAPGLDDAALAASATVSALTYVAYVWLAKRTGAVFTAQLSYVVTGSGLVWASMLLGEPLTPALLLAALLMGGGLALVRPRPA